jgi:myo-inositol 2-dehydrogenase/D-chiro-inositol 1-dehydrogenase
MTVRVGVIGAGNIGTSHARDLTFGVSGSAVSVVYDADSARAAGLAAALGGRSASSVAELIEADDVDAVLIASPDDFHADHALACLAVGKQTLCEKPLAPVEADARTVLDAEVAQGRRLIMMGFMRRFDPGYVQLKAELSPEGIGDPLIVHNIHRNVSAPYGLASDRTLTNMVIHEFDIDRWLLDEEFASVTVLTGKSGPLTPEGEHDPLLVILQSANGVIVEIEAFVNAQYGYEVVCRVTGTQGQAVMGDGAFITRSKAGSRGVDVPELWLGRFADAYRLQLQAWIDAVRSGGPIPGASAWDGYAATIVANRAIASLHAGQKVSIDLPERPSIYA